MSNSNEKYIIKGEFSQKSRLIQALLPSTIPIDSRTIDDFLLYALRFSEQLQYYNEENKPDGNWLDFFVSDETILYRVLAKINLSEDIAVYESLSNKLYYSIDEKEQADILSGIFYVQLRLINYIFTIEAGIKKQSKSNFFQQEFFRILAEEKFQEQLYQFAQLVKFYYQLFPAGKINDEFQIIDKIVISSDGKEEILPTRNLSNDLYEDAIWTAGKITEIFEKLRNIVSSITSAAAYQYSIMSEHKERKPHIALLITFLELYKYLQEAINEIPAKHLDFYYRTFLSIKEKSAVADSVFLYIKQAQNAPFSFLLQRGTQYYGDVSPDQTVVFEQQKPYIISRGTIVDMKTVFVLNNKGVENFTNPPLVQIGTPPIITEKDIIEGKELVNSWPLLGKSTNNQYGLNIAEMGTLISSPILLQKNAVREFICDIYPDSKRSEVFEVINSFSRFSNTNELNSKEIKNHFNKREYILQHIFSDLLELYITIDNGWFHIKRKSISLEELESGSPLRLKFTLEKADPDISIYQEKIHKLGFNEKNPVLKLIINPQAPVSGYHILKGFIIQRITIRVGVSESTDFEVASNLGPIDKSKPFFPFGAIPMPGSYFELKSNTIFNQFTESSIIHIKWAELPKTDLGFKEHYAMYPRKYTNHSFESNFSNAHRSSHDIEEVRKNIFETEDSDSAIGPLNTNSYIKLDHLSDIRFFNPAKEVKEQDVFQNNYMYAGNLKIELLNPEDGFGHKAYSKLFSDIVLLNSQRKKKKLPLPNEPYTPIIKKITINYRLFQSQQILSKSDDLSGDDDIKVYQLLPFGFAYTFPVLQNVAASMVHNFEQDGNLFIALNEIEPNQKLSIFFEIDETRAEDLDTDANEYTWSFLSQNVWNSLSNEDIIADETAGFLKAGSVTLQLPQDLDVESCLNNTLLPKGYCWLRLSGKELKGGMPHVKRILRNIIIAQRVIEDNLFTSPILSSGVVDRLAKVNLSVESVVQLGPSFGGKLKESNLDYLQRVSEMLRHKNRAISARDISSILLEKFREIFWVKCLVCDPASDTKYTHGNDLEIVVLPSLTKEDTPKTTTPRVSLLLIIQMRNYLKKFIPADLTIMFMNPAYEKVRVVCTVVIKKAFQSVETEGFYKQKLNRELQQFITPWLFDQSEASNIERPIYKNEVYNFIQDRTYIESVKSLSLLHLYAKDSHIAVNSTVADKYVELNDSAINKIEAITPTKAQAILITSLYHLINISKESDIDEVVPSGIGRLIIGEDLHIQNPKDKTQYKTESNTFGAKQLFNFEIN